MWIDKAIRRILISIECVCARWEWRPHPHSQYPGSKLVLLALYLDTYLFFIFDSMFKMKCSKSREMLELGAGGFEHLNTSTRHVPRSEIDLGYRIPRIQELRSWRILDLIFSFSHGILEILDPVTATLPWDPRDLGSRTEKILLDPGYPESSSGELSWDHADLGSCITKVPLHHECSLHPINFIFWFPICRRWLNFSTVTIFNHILIQPYCVDLKTSSSYWFLHMFSVIGVGVG